MSLFDVVSQLAEKGFVDPKAEPYLRGFDTLSVSTQKELIGSLAEQGYFDPKAQPYLEQAFNNTPDEEELVGVDYSEEQPMSKEVNVEAPADWRKAIAPRMVKMEEEGDTSTLRTLASGVLDATSLPGRLLAAGVEAPFSDKSFNDLMSQKEADKESSTIGGFLEDVTRDPLTLATLGAGGIGANVARKLIPEVAGAVGKGLGRRMGQGAVAAGTAGLVGGAPVSTLQVLAGEKTPLEAGIQTGAITLGGGLVGGAIPAIGAGAKKLLQGKYAPKPEEVTPVQPFSPEVASGEYPSLAQIASPEARARLGLPEPEEAMSSRATQEPTKESVINASKQAQKITGDKATGREEAKNKIVANALGLTEKEVAKNLPDNIKGYGPNFTDEDVSLLKNYYNLEMQSASPTRAEELPTAMQYVAQDLVKGLQELKKVRSNAGARMGQIEQAAAQDNLDKVGLLGAWEDVLNKQGLRLVQGDERILIRPNESGSRISDGDVADLQKMVDDLVNLNDRSPTMSSEQLRNFEHKMRSQMNRNAIQSTRAGTMTTQADALANDIFSAMSKGTENNIKNQLGEEAFKEYVSAKKAYAGISQDMDYLQRRLGQKAENEVAVPWSDDLETMVSSARGAQMLERLYKGLTDNRVVSLSQAINQLTGNDVAKKAALAKYAGEVAKTQRSGSKQAPANKMNFGGVIGTAREMFDRTPTMAETFDKVTSAKTRMAQTAPTASQTAQLATMGITVQDLARAGLTPEEFLNMPELPRSTTRVR